MQLADQGFMTIHPPKTAALSIRVRTGK